MSQLRSRPESLVADYSTPTLPAPKRINISTFFCCGRYGYSVHRGLHSVFAWPLWLICYRPRVHCRHTVNRATTCLVNLEMSGNLTAVREMSGILLKIKGIVREKVLSVNSCLKLFIVNCLFVSIQVFSRSLLCLKC